MWGLLAERGTAELEPWEFLGTSGAPSLTFLLQTVILTLSRVGVGVGLGDAPFHVSIIPDLFVYLFFTVLSLWSNQPRPRTPGPPYLVGGLTNTMLWPSRHAVQLRFARFMRFAYGGPGARVAIP